MITMTKRSNKELFIAGFVERCAASNADPVVMSAVMADLEKQGFTAMRGGSSPFKLDTNKPAAGTPVTRSNGLFRPSQAIATNSELKNQSRRLAEIRARARASTPEAQYAAHLKANPQRRQMRGVYGNYMTHSHDGSPMMEDIQGATNYSSHADGSVKGRVSGDGKKYEIRQDARDRTGDIYGADGRLVIDKSTGKPARRVVNEAYAGIPGQMTNRQFAKADYGTKKKLLAGQDPRIQSFTPEGKAIIAPHKPGVTVGPVFAPPTLIPPPPPMPTPYEAPHIRLPSDPLTVGGYRDSPALGNYPLPEESTPTAAPAPTAVPTAVPAAVPTPAAKPTPTPATKPPYNIYDESARIPYDPANLNMPEPPRSTWAGQLASPHRVAREEANRIFPMPLATMFTPPAGDEVGKSENVPFIMSNWKEVGDKLRNVPSAARKSYKNVQHNMERLTKAMPLLANFLQGGKQQ